MTEQSKTALRDNLLGLAGHCPVDQSNPEDCPLFALRQLGPARRLQWLNDLAEADLAYLTAYHSVCMQIRMESRAAKVTRMEV